MTHESLDDRSLLKSIFFPNMCLICSNSVILTVKSSSKNPTKSMACDPLFEFYRIIAKNVAFGRSEVLTLGQRWVLLAVWMQIMHWNVSIRPILSFAIWVGDNSGQTGGIISLLKKLYFGQLELKSLFSFKKQNLFVQNYQKIGPNQ